MCVWFVMPGIAVVLMFSKTGWGMRSDGESDEGRAVVAAAAAKKGVKIADRR